VRLAGLLRKKEIFCNTTINGPNKPDAGNVRHARRIWQTETEVAGYNTAWLMKMKYCMMRKAVKYRIAVETLTRPGPAENP
jgi:hypothetical protein